MWQHYKKTFIKMQTAIWLLTASVYLFFGHHWTQTIELFVVMQFSAVMGARWAVRFRTAMEKSAMDLPLRPRA